MLRVKLLTLLGAIGAAIVLCSALCLAAENAKRLYPACSITEYSTSAGSQVSSTLYNFSARAHALALNCLAYEVVSLNAEKGKDYCRIKHQADYTYALGLQAVYTNDSGTIVRRMFSISDMTGGSLTELTARMPARSKFSIVFTNLAADPRCNLRVRALFSYETANEGSAEDSLPTVVAVNPRTVYSTSARRSVLVLNYGVGQVASSSDIVSLVDFSLGTCERPHGDVLYMDYSTVIPDTGHFDGNWSQLSARATTFYEPNTFRVCYRSSNSSVATQIAVITVYAGNPAYYDIVSGLSERGEVLTGVETTIKFYGHDLDTREKGDEAKFVDFATECDTGNPAGGVLLANHLKPADSYGLNTTYSLWTWVMTEGGSYKVCYKRKATNVWTEVPFIEDVAITDSHRESTTRPPIPVPTNPSTHAECPKATETAERPWSKFTSVEIVLKAKKLPGGFLNTLSNLLCLRRSMLTLVHLKHNSEGKQVVLLALNCEEEKNATARECSSTERLNYFVSLSKDQLQYHGIASVLPRTDMLAFDDDESKRKGRSALGVLLLSLCILGIGGLIVFLVSRYHERRHHFIQFGLDDDEIDDMYDFNAAPTSAMRNQYDAAAQVGPIRVSNAVIELED
ncbi:hypothetical protein LSCM1_07264 [Leishmania martiniquensis]|uniref:Golgi/lysosome glycoprotein n=1 Tax=Leishmania martiniquensis TaxID=1580590 RepID=A0A836H5B6_9TRYP|nr:hypothetical protein LSCM1_07264 [Leishmania martiniquensis]